MSIKFRLLIGILTLVLLLTACSAATGDETKTETQKPSGQETTAQETTPEETETKAVETESETVIETEPPVDMTDSYRRARELYREYATILLPALENVTTDNDKFEIDEGQHLRDLLECEFVCADPNDVPAMYAAFKEAVIKVLGEPSETDVMPEITMDQWSVPHLDEDIPYRYEVMMDYSADTSYMYMMWRKQPVAIIHVTSEGPGEAHGISWGRVDDDIVEIPYTESWEIVDAFHGTLEAVAESGKAFLGWYVNDVMVCESSTYYFNFDKEDVDFTEITFEARFGEKVSLVTQSYLEQKEIIYEIIGVELPDLEQVEATGSGNDYSHKTVIENVSEDQFYYLWETVEEMLEEDTTVEWNCPGVRYNLPEQFYKFYTDDGDYIRFTWHTEIHLLTIEVSIHEIVPKTYAQALQYFKELQEIELTPLPGASLDTSANNFFLTDGTRVRFKFFVTEPSQALVLEILSSMKRDPTDRENNQAIIQGEQFFADILYKIPNTNLFKFYSVVWWFEDNSIEIIVGVTRL